MSEPIFLEELAKYLEDNSVGTRGLPNSGSGWGIYIIHRPDKADKMITLTPIPSSSDPEIPVSSPSFQVMLVAKDTQQAMLKAQDINNLLHRKQAVEMDNIYAYYFACTVMPYPIGIDDNHRAMIVMEFDAMLRGQYV